MTRHLPIAALVAALLATASVSAETIAVCAKGCDHTTIQHAIGAATSGDIIEIPARLHDETPSTCKSLTIREAAGIRRKREA